MAERKNWLNNFWLNKQMPRIKLVGFYIEMKIEDNADVK